MTLSNVERIQYGATITLTTVQCYKCGMPFAIPQEFKENLLNARVNNYSPMFYCPAGHGQSYLGKTDAQLERELRERAEAESKRLSDSRDYYQGKLADTTRILSATKGVVTRKKRELNRVKNGVCPCCTRSFSNLLNHMKSKHPEFQHA